MTIHSLPAGMVRAMTNLGPHAGYMPGFGNDFETEALPGALPQGMNSPQKCTYGLYGEQLSGTAFTAPSHQNERTWCYRIRPSVKHTHRFRKIDVPLWKQPEVIDILRAAAVPLGLALVGLVVFFGLIRPALKAALEPRPAQAGNNLNAVVADEEPLPEPELQMLEPPKTNPQLEQARILAKDNPAAVAGIVREWVSGEAA